MSISRAEVLFLQRLIDAERDYLTRKRAGEVVTRVDRGVEVGRINGVNPVMARSMVEKGLIEIVQEGSRIAYAYLDSYVPLDEERTYGKSGTHSD